LTELAIQHEEYFQLTPLGVIFHDVPPVEVWGEALESLLDAGRALPMIIGDLINFGESAYGEKYSQFLPLGYSYGHLRNLASVMARVPMEHRKEGLEFGHYRAVASLTDEQQEEYLQLAAKQEMLVGQLEDRVKEDLGLSTRPSILWQGLSVIERMKDRLVCPIWMPGELAEGQEVSITISGVKRV